MKLLATIAKNKKRQIIEKEEPGAKRQDINLLAIKGKDRKRQMVEKEEPVAKRHAIPPKMNK